MSEWIKWHGSESSESPERHGEMLEIQWRQGDIVPIENLDYIRWTHTGAGDDILAYRVISEKDTSKSDGSTASYYELPEGATELQHLISYRNLNAQDGEMFRAIYRKGRASHSDELRDAKKVLYYAQAEVDRLESLK